MGRLVVVAGLLTSHGVLAGPEGTPARARADRLFAEGRALAKALRFAEACKRFAESDALQRTFGTAANLGDCAVRDGQLARAWQLYEDAARVAERDGTAVQVNFARERAAQLAPKLCTVIVTIADPALPGMTVRIGDRFEPPAPRIRVLVDPGDIDVVVTAPGVPTLRRTLHGTAGSAVTIDVPDPSSAGPLAARAAPLVPGLVVPGFVVIERFDSRSLAGVEGVYVRPTDPLELGRATMLRFEAHARYVDPARGLGAYARIPLAYGSDTDLFDEPFTATQFGNIEIGGLLVRKLSTRNVAFVVHAGATLPTAEAGTSEESLGNLVSKVAMPQIYNSLARGVTGSLGVSAALRKNNLFAQLDLGIDWNFYRQNRSAAGGAIQYGAGGGIDLGTIAVMLELENVALSNDNEALHAIALSARADLGTASLYGAIVNPFGEDLADLVDLAVVVGAEFMFPR